MKQAPGHFIFFISSTWAIKARVLHYTMLEKLAWEKHSSLLGPESFVKMT
jgi:hypothetical protein